MLKFYQGRTVSNNSHLLENGEITRTILETVGALVLVMDPQGRIVFFNSACQEISGYSEVEALGRAPWDFLLPPHICGSVKNVFLKLSDGDFPGTHENVWLTKSGKEKTIAWSNSATLNDDRSVNYVIATGIDITERASSQTSLESRVEERTRELTQANQELMKSEARLARAQAISNQGNWEWDIKSGGLIWSDEIYRIFGRRPREFAPTYDAFLAAIHPDDREKVSEAVNQAVENDEPYSIVHRVVCPDGEEKIVQEIGDVLRDENGAGIRMDGTVHDITRDWHSREALIKASRIAVEASRAKSEFLASMSHELRTPLNAVLGFAQIMQADSSSPPDARQTKNIEYILDGGNHLLELVNEILDLAKIEAGQLALSIGVVDANKVVADCVALALPLSELRGVSVFDEFNHQSSTNIHVDHLRLTQVLINLLSNAIKYNRKGGTVTIGGHKTTSNSLRISVTDTGLGIARKDHTKLFQMFGRVGASHHSSIEGSGIGLAMTKALVESMSGKIGFESEEGVGSTFWVELPMAPVETAHG